MLIGREELKRKVGVREAADLDCTVDVRMEYRPPDFVIASLHPAVVLTTALASVSKKAAELAANGHPVLAAEIRPSDAGFAGRAEGAIVAARTLAHFTGGRTLDLYAEGGAVAAAAVAYGLERPFFDGFYPIEPQDDPACPVDWRALVKGK